MDLLERARALAACPLFEDLAPAVLVRFAERATARELERGERRATDDSVLVVAAGSLAVTVDHPAHDLAASDVRARGGHASAGNVLGMIRVVRPETPRVEVIAETPSVVIAIAIDDVRDVLEEDPVALAALADRLATLLLGEPA